jgi:hydroxymethylglutaryl-CoA lyase
LGRKEVRDGMSNLVKIIECPRDAWQGLPKNMPAEVKADYLRVLIAAGFKHIDAVSFVSRAAVPQMADSELVMEYLDPPDFDSKDNDGVEIIGIVVNAKGAERAVKTGSVQTLGFPYSISPEFLKRNQNQTPEESLEELEKVGTLAYKAGMDVVAYISMAFGNPYGEAWDIDEVVAACDLLADNGVKQISLADTVGLATPKQVADVVADVIAVHGDATGRGGIEIGVHLHARPDNAAAKVRAAYEAGCRRFDAAIGGLGGCPFAQDALVGNMATETLLAELRALGAELPPLRPLDGLIAASAEIERKYGAKVQ